ncbi:cuticular protein 47Eg-like [Procambarus clarkii]|uniref:cuticular protein 47Eg-like n=1 Tax=Procambarus clarkii TaxID=6728 RepID=UPI001E673DB5|nr:cuticular protein 47Eg-like isoform X2 [Procambarus clarkii]
MNTYLVVLLGVAALVAARPDFSLEDIHQDQVIGKDNTITGSYSWTSPEGVEYFVKYIADKDGYRVLESNAVPVTADGVKADGRQGSFVSSEEDDDDRK